MKRLLACLIVLGSFAVLASYSFGKSVSRQWNRPISPHAEATPPHCGLDWLCLKTWASGKPPEPATPEDMARLVERSVAEARRHRILSGSDEQAALRELWGPGE